jgi:hypothetical protein
MALAADIDAAVQVFTGVAFSESRSAVEFPGYEMVKGERQFTSAERADTAPPLAGPRTYQGLVRLPGLLSRCFNPLIRLSAHSAGVR